jgi:hypothetical protein
MSVTRLSKFNYKLYFNSSANEHFLPKVPLVLKSILHMIPNLGGAIIKSDDGYYIDFCAQSVQPLTEFKKSLDYDYNTVISIIYSLNKQQTFLSEKYNHGMFFIDLKDIVVIDSSIFICINPELVKSINSFGEFSFYSPFSRASNSAFFSPEILAIDKIPSCVDCKCFYYSLGALAIYCLFNKNIKGLTELEIKQLLNPIYQTKLYWMLLKSVSLDYERRTLLFI